LTLGTTLTFQIFSSIDKRQLGESQLPGNLFDTCSAFSLLESKGDLFFGEFAYFPEKSPIS
jgi:hypothetical protein